MEDSGAARATRGRSRRGGRDRFSVEMDPATHSGPVAKLAAGSLDDPALFGPYLLYGLIARGGMAEVYRARRRGASSDKMLAI